MASRHLQAAGRHAKGEYLADRSESDPPTRASAIVLYAGENDLARAVFCLRTRQLASDYCGEEGALWPASHLSSLERLRNLLCSDSDLPTCRAAWAPSEVAAE